MSGSPRNPAQTPENDQAAVLRVSRGMRVSEIVGLLPEAGPLIAEYGLHCFQCEAGAYESLEEGCRSHGFSDEDIDDLVTDLNELLAQRPARPATLDVTADAARGLATILAEQGKEGWILVVQVDEAGAFCLEFAEKIDPSHRTFGHTDVPSLTVAADPYTLARIGGATIDLRDGRFALDMDNAPRSGCGCKDGGTCGC